jgi:hypothetical protein
MTSFKPDIGHARAQVKHVTALTKPALCSAPIQIFVFPEMYESVDIKI